MVVRLTRITTKTGDGGETSLGNGLRVAKHALRVEAYGTVEEANAALGLAVLRLEGEYAAMLRRIQNDLFDLGADLCTPHEPAPKYEPLRIAAVQIERLEAEQEQLNKNLAPLNSFILPGGTEAAAALHLARTIVRRAERHITALAAVELVNPLALQYINRLSDHLFVLGRVVNHNGQQDCLWAPAQNR